MFDNSPKQEAVELGVYHLTLHRPKICGVLHFEVEFAYGEDVTLKTFSKKLLWRSGNREVLFVWVKHPLRGKILLMSTALDLTEGEIILAYSLRMKIETGFKAAKHHVKMYSYRFWSKAMKPIKRRSKGQHLHRESEAYREKMGRKLRTYQLYVQVGCIAQGILQYLGIQHSGKVWHCFRGWLRTIRPGTAPSEQVVAMALSASIPEFLRVESQGDELADIMASRIEPSRVPGILLGQSLCA
jgi:hypothetical protein